MAIHYLDWQNEPRISNQTLITNRDLNGAVKRMATLAPTGRITVEVGEEETGRLKGSWRDEAVDLEASLLEAALGQETAAELDRFDRVQLPKFLKCVGLLQPFLNGTKAVCCLAARGKKQQ